MYRPIVKYVVRAALFASAVAAIGCSNPTAPAPVSSKTTALKSCANGYTIMNGIVVCNPG